jgi:hypothetical protein
MRFSGPCRAMGNEGLSQTEAHGGLPETQCCELSVAGAVAGAPSMKYFLGEFSALYPGWATTRK